jgi:prophage antirepressor-like protein
MSKPDNNPEARVALFQSREIRRTLHNDEWWFVITDIVAALTDAADPSDYWKKMRRRDPDLSLDSQGGGQIDPPLRCLSIRQGEGKNFSAGTRRAFSG